jgi:hypothetical protein
MKGEFRPNTTTSEDRSGIWAYEAAEPPPSGNKKSFVVAVLILPCSKKDVAFLLGINADKVNG